MFSVSLFALETFRVGVPDVDLAKNKDKPWKG